MNAPVTAPPLVDLPPMLRPLAWMARKQTQATTVRIPIGLLDRLDALASRIGCDRSDVIRTALLQWLEQLELG